MNIDSVQLPGDWVKVKEHAGAIAAFRNSDGDPLELHYYPTPPELQADLTDDKSVWDRYLRDSERNNMNLMEARGILVDGIRAAYTLVQKRDMVMPSGFTYIGGITLPFADRWFIVKLQCEEQGFTGVREATVKLGRSARASSDPRAHWKGEFEFDDPCHRAYDSMFKDHPLSRIRRSMDDICVSTRLNADVKAMKPYVFKTGRFSGWLPF